MEAVKAQCMNGMWGHSAALPDGHSEGYGGMNQIGLPMTISLVLARQAGVTRSGPRPGDSSGPSACCAGMSTRAPFPMAITSPGRGMRTTANAPARRCFSTCWAIARRRAFFARMATAAYDEREHGHSGNFFNMLWALPGVSRCGPLATGAY